VDPVKLAGLGAAGAITAVSGLVSTIATLSLEDGRELGLLPDLAGQAGDAGVLLIEEDHNPVSIRFTRAAGSAMLAPPSADVTFRAIDGGDRRHRTASLHV
jgi:hypothetical protein